MAKDAISKRSSGTWKATRTSFTQADAAGILEYVYGLVLARVCLLELIQTVTHAMMQIIAITSSPQALRRFRVHRG